MRRRSHGFARSRRASASRDARALVPRALSTPRAAPARASHPRSRAALRSLGKTGWRRSGAATPRTAAWVRSVFRLGGDAHSALIADETFEAQSGGRNFGATRAGLARHIAEEHRRYGHCSRCRGGAGRPELGDLLPRTRQLIGEYQYEIARL